MNKSIAFSLAVALLGSTATGQVPQTADPERHGAAEAVRTFWQAVGVLDGDRVVACLDWPNVIIETGEDGTRPVRTEVDGDAVKAEIARSRSSERKPRRGDLFGTTVTHLEVRPLSPTLVYVPHRCRVGGDRSASAGREHREFDAVAIVRKEHVTGTWRIMAITVTQ